VDEKVACIKKLGKRNKNATTIRSEPIINEGSKNLFFNFDLLSF